ncbi:MAG: hypothetical protein WB421_16335 [Terriglobales bacterium]
MLDPYWEIKIEFSVMSAPTIASPKKSPISVGRIVLIVFAVIIAYCVTNYEQFLPHHWQTYTSPDGSFSIQLPDKPSVEPTQVPLEGGGTANVNVITATPTDHTAFSCVYFEDENIGRKSPGQALDSALDGSLRKIQGTVVTQKKITVQGNPGLEVQARGRGNSLVDMRIVVASNRMFLIMAVATAEQDREPKTVQHVFDSFKINQK